MSRTAWGTRVLWATGIVTALAVAAGVWVIDSPAQQRLKRLDAARVSDLQTLDSAARNYQREHEHLPADFAALTSQPGVELPTKNAQGGSDYRYRVLDAMHFELCARFDTASTGPQRRMRIDEWAHPAGDHCFRRSVSTRNNE